MYTIKLLHLRISLFLFKQFSILRISGKTYVFELSVSWRTLGVCKYSIVEKGIISPEEETWWFGATTVVSTYNWRPLKSDPRARRVIVANSLKVQ